MENSLVLWYGQFKLADRIPIIPEVETFSLQAANCALMELKNRRIRGVKVLLMDHR